MKADQNGGKVKKQTGSLFGELGVPKGQLWSTYNSDFLPELRGPRAVKWFREMSDNDDQVGEILFAIEMLIRQVDWTVEPGGETPQDEEAAAFLESQMDDMSHSWPDFIAAVLTMLPFGWSAHEIVYKLRNDQDSKFDDGRIGWRKFSYQPQENLHDWVLDAHGGLEAFQWQAGGMKGEIPVEKLLLFRTTTARGPNGKSVLRNAWRSYRFKKRLEEYAAIGVDRDLNGLPVLGIPAEMILDDDDFFAEAKEFVTRLKKDELWGAVVPVEYEDGNKVYEFDVLRSDGASSLSATKDLITMFAQGIAGTVLASFVRLGRDAVGARALADPQQQLFQKAIQGWVDAIAEVLNRHAVPRLFAINDFTLEKLPRFKPEKVEDPALDETGRYLLALAQAGFDLGQENPDDPINDQVRQLGGFDAAPIDSQTGLGKRLVFDGDVYKVKDS